MKKQIRFLGRYLNLIKLKVKFQQKSKRNKYSRKEGRGSAEVRNSMDCM